MWDNKQLYKDKNIVAYLFEILQVLYWKNQSNLFSLSVSFEIWEDPNDDSLPLLTVVNYTITGTIKQY